MDVGGALRDSRVRAGLTQAGLARLAGTSQATISAYESARKQPSVSTLDRLLEAVGTRVVLEPDGVIVQPSAAQHRRAAEALSDVLTLAEALPTHHHAELRYPPLAARASA